jgi:hypothetical protein
MPGFYANQDSKGQDAGVAVYRNKAINVSGETAG